MVIWFVLLICQLEAKFKRRPDLLWHIYVCCMCCICYQVAMASPSDAAIASTSKQLSASSSLTNASDQVAPMYFLKQMSANGHQFSSLVDANNKPISFPQGMTNDVFFIKVPFTKVSDHRDCSFFSLLSLSSLFPPSFLHLSYIPRNTILLS